MAEEQGVSRSKLMAHILEVGASDSDDAQSLLIDIEQKIAEFRKAQTEE